MNLILFHCYSPPKKKTFCACSQTQKVSIPKISSSAARPDCVTNRVDDLTGPLTGRSTPLFKENQYAYDKFSTIIVLQNSCRLPFDEGYRETRDDKIFKWLSALRVFVVKAARICLTSCHFFDKLS